MPAVLSDPLRQIRYRVEQAIGHGPTATVFKAYDPVGQRLVALKALRRPLAGTAQGLRLLEQAGVAARLAHPGIAAIHDIERTATSAAIVSEYLAGRNLAQWLAASTQPALATLVDVMEQVLDALAHAHQAGLRHGGLKPTNVLFTAAGRVKLTDFGMARMDDPAIYRAAVKGLVAPEVAAGRPLDHGVDIYAAGVLLYRLLAGCDPQFADGSDGGAIGALRAPGSLSPTLRAPGFDTVAARALAHEPGDRYPHAQAFREALRAALGQPRPIHGAQSVELGDAAASRPAQAPGVRDAEPSAPVAGRQTDAVQAEASRAEVLAAKALQAPSAEDLVVHADVSQSPAAALGGAAPAGPGLTLEIPDEILGMPAFDPYATLPQIPAPRQAPALLEDDDSARVRAVIGRAEEGRRAHVTAAARAASVALQAAAAASAAGTPLILAEPAFVPPSESVFGTDLALLGRAPVSPDIPAESLRRVLKVLTPHFGARAGILLKQVAGQAATLDELHALLDANAGETVDRRRMRKQLKAVARLPL